ncbi:hypothetical protein ACRALDRAFT_2080653, partial [Sodiomyces alcalophilus JCM 7366]|uniref:uncharacterized protein n=1 Tax=Sodiomyces alcalophilus JCM 7366 TaxID=591952 RepID=UPI0039B3F985
GWKPAILSPAVLICFALLSLILVAIIEVLAQQSQMAGGLSLSTDPDDLSPFATFSYLFLPTIIAVFYSLFWSWVDLDAKRTQPWFEMSREGGATAKDSVLLTYPYDFVGFVPFRAFKNRHWPVFFSGTTMTIIMWAIVPLQAAIMATDTIIRTRDVSLVHDLTFLPVSEHPMTIDNSILNHGYAITWLDQTYPPFTTPDYTIMPFQVQTSDLQTPTVNRNWTGTSVKYWTDLDCWPAQISRYGPTSRRTFDFLNGRGCNVSDIAAYGAFGGTTPYKMFYLGYQDSAYASYAMESPTCRNAHNQFLAIWTHHNGSLMLDQPNDIRLQAAFCETSYHKQPVRVTVSGEDFAPIEESVVPLGPVEPLTEAEFNITSFEYLLGAGVSAVELRVQRDFPFGRLLEQYPHAIDMGLTWPMSPMVGFAIGSQKEELTSLHAFQNFSRLTEAYTVAHKQLFSLALRRVMVNATETLTTQGTEDVELHGIVVSRLLSAVVEGLLGLVTVFVLALAWTCRKAPSSLTEDPNSLASLMDICRDSSALLDSLAGKGCLPEEELTKALQNLRFKLVCRCQTRYGQTIVEVLGGNVDAQASRLSLDRRNSAAARGHYTPIRPWALRRPLGALVIVAMVGAMICLVYLKQQEQIRGGLVPPNASFEVQQLLLSFLPTIFATLMEPFWVLLNRFLCILQPFKDLWSGHSPAKGTINARYTAIPPQLVLWRALGAGHFLLAMLAAVALLSNVLAVGLGGIFNQHPVQARYPRTFETMPFVKLKSETMNSSDFLPMASVIPYDEPFVVLMNNISQNTPFPPWISQDYYFQPFTLPDSQGTLAHAYTSTTRGFGVKTQCSPLGKFDSQGVGPLVNHTISRRGSVVPDCPTSYQTEDLTLGEPRGHTPLGPSATEVVRLFAHRPELSLRICDVMLLLGWSRSSQVEDTQGFMETTFVVCEPEFTTALFELTVDRQGVVLTSKQVSKSSNTLDYQLSTNHTDTLIGALNFRLAKEPSAWHNDTLSRDWMNYLLKITPQHENLLDPHADLPDPEVVIPSIERIYRAIFALILGLNDEVFERSPEPIRLEGVEHRTETRIFIPLPAFIMSVAVLGLDVVVATILYGFGIKHFLPRMPTTIGSILAYVAPSRALREYDPVEECEKTKITTTRGATKPSSTFSFGRYIGDDGRAHIGIELDPYVVPLHLSSLRKGNTRPTKSLFARIRLGRQDSSQKKGADAWL